MAQLGNILCVSLCFQVRCQQQSGAASPSLLTELQADLSNVEHRPLPAVRNSDGEEYTRWCGQERMDWSDVCRDGTCWWPLLATSTHGGR